MGSHDGSDDRRGSDEGKQRPPPPDGDGRREDLRTKKKEKRKGGGGDDEDRKGEGYEGRKRGSRDRDRGRDGDKERGGGDRSRREKRSRDDRRRRDGGDGDDDGSRGRRRRRKRKESLRSSSRRHGRRGRSRRSDRKKRRRRRDRSSSSSSSSSSDSSVSSSSSSSSSSGSGGGGGGSKPTSSRRKVANARLLAKLSARGETLEEREERRAKRRAARIAERFGYTADDNPFNDPNIAETFSWKKREEKVAIAASGAGGGSAAAGGGGDATSRRTRQDHIFSEIDKVRQRRQDRELHFEEMERLRAEESRMKELENYDEWARREEEFHLQQQRQRSAIRLVEGRERPVDVLAKNLLLFGLTEEEKRNRAAVKYREKYNALDELETLEAELEEPHVFLRDLKLNELQELLADVDAFRTLEREAAAAAARDAGEAPHDDNPILRYWDALHLVTLDEIKYVNTGGTGGTHASVVEDIQKMFEGQSRVALEKMRGEIQAKLRGAVVKFDSRDEGGGVVDTDYWQTVLDQLAVHLAKLELSDIHSKMLVRQLEKLERRKDELAKASAEAKAGDGDGAASAEVDARHKAEEEAAAAAAAAVPKGVEPDFGNLEEELGLGNEVDVAAASYAWQDKYRPRKPRYFNRVKTGYDWNKYNQTHYDHDNPPPKTVQGYKFNIFYPDLIDKTKTPQYFLEPADSDDFCILRFHAGPPYEDVAFKIINREWNRSRKRGFRCTFERGVLSLYFNFASHWYRR